jgi:hypothetical protein
MLRPSVRPSVHPSCCVCVYVCGLGFDQAIRIVDLTDKPQCAQTIAVSAPISSMRWKNGNNAVSLWHTTFPLWHC